MCTATIPLGEPFASTPCQIEGEHPGRDHETNAWGPKITWPSRFPVTR